MKHILSFFALAFVLISCEGPQGPPGFDGLNGQDGTNIVAQSFEVTTSFAAPNYEQTFVVPNNITVLPTDMKLVYILWDQVQGNNGQTLDVWRLLPQVSYTDFGEFQYNYDFTQGDVRLFLDAPGSFNFGNLTAADLNNQTFRVVILPVDLANSNVINVNDYQSVVNYLGLDDHDFVHIEQP